jgi:hypothetical protein
MTANGCSCVASAARHRHGARDLGRLVAPSSVRAEACSTATGALRSLARYSPPVTASGNGKRYRTRYRDRVTHESTIVPGAQPSIRKALGESVSTSSDGTALDMSGPMKIVALCVLASCLGCAASAPLLISDQQRRQFEDVVREAEAAGAAEGPPLAASRLAEAKSEFEYSQHLPMYPDRARLLVAKAQEDADAALEMSRAQAQSRLAAREEARHQALVGAASP